MKDSIKVTVEEQTFLAVQKTFSTGSRGYWAGGTTKILIDGKPHQVSLNIVEIGSKPGSETKAKGKK